MSYMNFVAAHIEKFEVVYASGPSELKERLRRITMEPTRGQVDRWDCSSIGEFGPWVVGKVDSVRPFLRAHGYDLDTFDEMTIPHR